MAELEDGGGKAWYFALQIAAVMARRIVPYYASDDGRRSRDGNEVSIDAWSARRT